MIFEERDWETLLPRIKAGTCTPFLGAAVNFGVLPLGGDIAQDWAAGFQYPLDSRSDLAKVSQYLAINFDPTRPKEMVLDKLDKDKKPFNLNDDSEPLNVLAKLPFPVYLTTNYDDLLFSAIEHHGRSSNRRPVFEVCKWNRSPSIKSSLFKRGSTFKPSAQTPVIYHLHGHKSMLDSLVLTEDDYLDFLVNMSKDINAFLPPRIQEAVTASSVLFVGYGLADTNFRVLFRGLLGNLEAALGKMSVAVQLPYDETNANKEKAEEYITKYFGNIRVRVYWGTAKKFAQELWDRWSKFIA
jgi:SIR2-like domain